MSREIGGESGDDSRFGKEEFTTENTEGTEKDGLKAAADWSSEAAYLCDNM